MRINRNNPSEIKDRLLTMQRRLLLDTLRQAKGHLDAKELYRRAIDKDPRISLATAYRNLRLFKELDEAGVREHEIDKVIVARAFGNYIDVASAVGLGMFPPLPLDRFSQVGNAAGVGAKLALTSKKHRASRPPEVHT